MADSTPPAPTPDAPDASSAQASDGRIGYEIFMAGLSILSIVNLVLYLFVKDEAMQAVIVVIGLLMTVIFFLDFVLRMARAPSKSEYFFHGFGWADLLSSLPFEQTNILRLFRLIRVYRLLHDYGIRRVGRALVRDRAETALLMLLLVGILVLEFGSLDMLRLEMGVPGANITNASDALWYVIVTMSTVGYGDEYPITNAGRVLGSLIIVVGVGIFGTLTGYLANLFLSPTRRSVDKQPEDLAARFAELRALAAQQQQALDEMAELLEKRD